jgi:hypothetical protein
VCCPYPFLAPVAEICKGTRVAVGAEDVFTEDKGAFTGGVSVAQLKSVGVKYVVVGHSERRCALAPLPRPRGLASMRLRSANSPARLTFPRLVQARQHRFRDGQDFPAEDPQGSHRDRHAAPVQAVGWPTRAGRQVLDGGLDPIVCVGETREVCGAPTLHPAVPHSFAGPIPHPALCLRWRVLTRTGRGRRSTRRSSATLCATCSCARRSQASGLRRCLA